MGEGGALPGFQTFSFCSLLFDHEKDWPQCTIKSFFGLATDTNNIIASFGKYFILPRFFAQIFAQMFPFGIFIDIEDPVRTSDVFWRRIRHDVAMSLALIDLKIHRIFVRRTHTI